MSNTKHDEIQFRKQLIADIYVRMCLVTTDDPLTFESASDFSIAAADALIEKIKNSKSLPEDIKIVPALDLSEIPENLYGQWLIIERHNSKLLGSGHTIESAISNADININTPGIVVARV